MINVTKTYLPDFEEYTAVLKRAWDKAWITNNGELLLELEDKLRNYLNEKNLLFCSNGTVVLQLALKELNITKEVITTPFSYVATTNVILWEGCKPVFVDIDPGTFCIDADKIEAAITGNTQAILATHVYGIPCDVEKIEAIAKKYNLKVIYDGAHSFGCTHKGRSLLTYGDISTCSFHATKVFHTVEGGCIYARDPEIFEKIKLNRSFGHAGDNYFSAGINAKNSEFHAAMGICILPKIPEIIEARKSVFSAYDCHLNWEKLVRPAGIDKGSYNYSYYPVVIEHESILLKVCETLEKNNITARRYFYPSLNKLPFLENANSCPVSEDISLRVLCLPVYFDLSVSEVKRICEIINKTI